MCHCLGRAQKTVLIPHKVGLLGLAARAHAPVGFEPYRASASRARWALGLAGGAYLAYAVGAVAVRGARAPAAGHGREVAAALD